MINPADIPTYRGMCVKPIDRDSNMCGAPAAYVSVRNDGWVSGTTWCAEHAETDNYPSILFRWARIAV